MAKTLVEKVASPKPDITIFKITGVLGYHENEVLEKFFTECDKKNITKLIVDFSDLGSLGGGCAKIIRERALAGGIVICVVGASTTVKSFLERGDVTVAFAPTVEIALDSIDDVTVPKQTMTPHATDADPVSGTSSSSPHRSQKDVRRQRESPLPPGPSTQPGQGQTAPAKNARASVATKKTETMDTLTAGAKSGGTVATGSPKPKDKGTDGDSTGNHNHDLERRLVQYRSLFSINVDFSRIKEKSRLLDAFLLTTIAQAGAESAAFLERTGDTFTLAAWKGFETADPKSLQIAADAIEIEEWARSIRVLHADKAPIAEEVKERLNNWELPYLAPFVVYGEFRGIVLLGNPIRAEFDHSTFEYLLILINQAAIAYENSCLFEEESKRTLGLVQSLISLIEENTLSRGNTETTVNYTYAVAKNMHYPEENVRDLIYGTVLRDIGMIKVSDLIVRSPRELQEGEWEIIKRHPIEGAEMLRRMKFSEHTTNVVLCHHERFNGQGYPNQMQGPQIPLGARIVSVVESYTAMLQDRPTRPALSDQEALNTLKENWGMRYDPDIVAQFVDIVEEEIRTGRLVKYQGSELFRD